MDNTVDTSNNIERYKLDFYALIDRDAVLRGKEIMFITLQYKPVPSAFITGRQHCIAEKPEPKAILS